MTRREVIKAGAGLAAIIAAGEAPAAIVRSMIGARNAFTTGGEPQYDWLESDGVAYVELPIKIGSDLVYEFSYMIPPNPLHNYGYVFGGYNGWNQTNPKRRYSVNFYQKSLSTSYGDVILTTGQPQKTTTVGSMFPWGVRRTVVFSQPSGIATIDGTDYEMDMSTQDDVPHSQGEMRQCLFACSSYNNIGYRPLQFRLWYFRILSGGELLFDFEPRVIDGRAVVYDRVSQTVLETLGGGTFTAGKDEI
jgi:hypothetical protein